MKVVVFHGSSNKLTFELNRIQILNKSKYDFRIFLGQRFFKRVVLLLNAFVLSHLLCYDNIIWSNVIFPKAFTYDFIFC
jgi:hypothetical protein